MASHLVIGASGFLGRNLLRALGERGVGTYSSNPFANGIAFDAVRQSFSDLEASLPPDLTHVFLLHGIANPDLCAREPEMTRAVNVASMQAMIREIQAAGLVPVYASTDYVFDGARGGRTENETTCPTTNYGRQKAEMEAWLADQGRPYLVFRSSKIVSGDTDTHSVLGQWVNDIRAGKSIKCAIDQTFSPAHVDDMVAALIELADGQQAGLYNTAGSLAISRFDLCAMLISSVKRVDPTITVDLQPILLSSIPFAEKRPLDTSLSVAKLESVLTHRFQSMSEVCDRVAGDAFP